MRRGHMWNKIGKYIIILGLQYCQDKDVDLFLG